MRLVKNVRTIILSLAAPALLSGCATSSPAVGLQARSSDAATSAFPELDGVMWIIPAFDDSKLDDIIDDFGAVEFTHGANGQYGLDYFLWGSKETLLDPVRQPITLLRTDNPDIIVWAMFTDAWPEGEVDDDAPAAMFILMLRSKMDTWLWCPGLNLEKDIIEGSTEAYLEEIASGHGIPRPIFKDDSGAYLGGDLDADSFIDLIEDPAFLGGVRLDPGLCVRLLPATLRSIPEERAGGPSIDASSSHAFPLPRNRLAIDPALTGEYSNDDGGKLTVTAQPDGTFLLTYYSGTSTYKLLPFDRPGRYLGIEVEWTDYADADDRTVNSSTNRGWFDYRLIELAPDGSIAIFYLTWPQQEDLPALAKAAHWLFEDTVKRHGLKMDGSRISGDLDVEKIRSLFLDPQLLAALNFGVNRWEPVPQE